MSESSLNSQRMRDLVERWQAGEVAAADELLRSARHRLERLARKMLKNYPTVLKSVEAEDVLQASVIRLLNSLRGVAPESKKHFYNLAALQIQRELIDLARHFGRVSHAAAALTDSAAHAIPNDGTGEFATARDSSFELWRQFHEAVGKLPAVEREIVGLVFYHGWTQIEIAELLHMDERTVRRRWQLACKLIRELVGGRFPPP